VLHPIERLSKGDTIYAVYPDTTSFYPATVVASTTKKGPAATTTSNAPPLKQPPYVMVQFVDDADEFGVTHDKAVPMQHVMIPPPQLLL
jgi:SGF29 tudor-like domain